MDWVEVDDDYSSEEARILGLTHRTFILAVGACSVAVHITCFAVIFARLGFTLQKGPAADAAFEMISLFGIGLIMTGAFLRNRLLLLVGLGVHVLAGFALFIVHIADTAIYMDPKPSDMWKSSYLPRPNTKQIHDRFQSVAITSAVMVAVQTLLCVLLSWAVSDYREMLELQGY